MIANQSMVDLLQIEETLWRQISRTKKAKICSYRRQLFKCSHLRTATRQLLLKDYHPLPKEMVHQGPRECFKTLNRQGRELAWQQMPYQVGQRLSNRLRNPFCRIKMYRTLRQRTQQISRVYFLRYWWAMRASQWSRNANLRTTGW